MNSNEITCEQIAANHSEFKLRLDHYKSLGLDHIALRKQVMELIDCQPKSILEVGTGKGILTIFLAQLCSSVISVDLNPDEQHVALLNLMYHHCEKPVTLLCTDASRLDYPDRHFDLVVSAISFHHFEEPEKVIFEMARLTCRQLIITDFNEHGFEIIEQSHQQENRHHFRTGHEFSIVPKWLEQQGFGVTTLSDECQTIYSAKRNGI